MISEFLERSTFVYQRKSYRFTSQGIVEDGAQARIPSAIEHGVLAVVAQQVLELVQREVIPIDELVQGSNRFRRLKMSRIAEILARAALDRDPGSESAAVSLSSAYRQGGRAEEALSATEDFLSSSNTALFTTRAGALMDLGRLDEAERCLKRAFASSNRKSPELKAAYCRYDALRAGR